MSGRVFVVRVVVSELPVDAHDGPIRDLEFRGAYTTAAAACEAVEGALDEMLGDWAVGGVPPFVDGPGRGA